MTGTPKPSWPQSARGRIHPQALTPEEKQAIVQVCNTPENASLPPSQIVPRLADQGQYLASESSFYRVPKEHGQVNRRGKAQPPKKVAAHQAWVAYESNQVWSWDIRYLPSTIKGQFMRLYTRVRQQIPIFPVFAYPASTKSSIYS